MSTATVTIAFTATPVPTGLTYAGLQVVFTDSTGAATTQTIPSTTAPTTAADGTLQYVLTFDPVADGDETVVVSAMATDGSVLGSALTGTGTVGTPTPDTFPQATSIAIS